MNGNTTSCNATIDLTGDSDCDSRRNTSRRRPRQRGLRSVRNSENNRKTKRGSTHQSNEIEVTSATIQSTCGVCIKKLEKIKAEGNTFHVTKCGHLFCTNCINMISKARPKYWEVDGKPVHYINCPTCQTRVLKGEFYKVYL